MENKIRFVPVVLDYPSRISTRELTDEELALIEQSSKRLSALIEKYSVHNIINNFIYLPLYKDGTRIDKTLRVKVDGPIYKQIVDANGGKFPRHIRISEATKLDADEMY